MYSITSGSLHYLAFTMSPRLTVQRPSPTTILFTVSNAPARRSWSSKLVFGIEVLLRILGFFSVLILDIAKIRRHIIVRDNGNWVVELGFWSTGLGSFICRIADQYTWPVIAIASATIMYLVWRKGYTGEFLSLPLSDLIQCLTSAQRNPSW